MTFPYREVAGLVKSAVQGRGAGKLVNVRLWLRPSPARTKLEAWAAKGTSVARLRRDTSLYLLARDKVSVTRFRRDISLYFLARDKTTILKRINLFGCYPVSCNAGDHDTGSKIKSIVFTCNVDRIEEAKG